jgi:hypothetical protein
LLPASPIPAWVVDTETWFAPQNAKLRDHASPFSLGGADSMKILSSLIVVGAVWGGYQMVSQHQAARALRDVMLSSDVNGFLDVPPPINQNLDTIYVVAAQNCPRAAALEADRLAKQLGAQGIPVERTNQVGFQPQRVDHAALSRLNVVMNGPLPLVFVHGRVASNPELSQVVEEYYRPGSTRTPR